jgi:hypothetical protein
MAIPITTTKRPLPPRIMIFGPGGIGKTTLAASIPGVVIMPVEEGADAIEVAKTPTPTTWEEALALIDALAQDSQGFKALAIDSVTALQELCYRAVCAEQNVASIEAYGGGYGKGYVRAAELWRELLNKLLALRQRMIVVLIGHAAIKKHEDPRTPAYDRLVPRLQIDSKGSGIGPMTAEWCDVVACAAYQVITDTTDQGFNKTRTTATGDGTRILYCQERPAFLAKNRYALPVELPFAWPDLVGGILANLRSTTKPAVTEAGKAA